MTLILDTIRLAVSRLSNRWLGSRHDEPHPRNVSRKRIEALIGMPVGDMAFYEQALRHRSILRGEPDSHLLSNERLEFLGDAVLGYIAAEHLFHHFPQRDEGFLTRMRSKIVNGQALSHFATTLDLGSLILLSDNMAQSNGRRNPTILADALEAVIGAVFLDLGEAATRRFVEEKILKEIDLEDLAHQRDNYKSLLLEYVQALGWEQPRYQVADEDGPSHEKTFTVEVILNDDAYGRGRARSKKKAEQEAASQALDRLRHEEPHE
ncbi:MAG: ribonuclease III [Rhodothermales bacterium]